MLQISNQEIENLIHKGQMEDAEIGIYVKGDNIKTYIDEELEDVEFSLDLTGYTVQEAYKEAEEWLETVKEVLRIVEILSEAIDVFQADVNKDKIMESFYYIIDNYKNYNSSDIMDCVEEIKSTAKYINKYDRIEIGKILSRL